jgi:hypothetical protein
MKKQWQKPELEVLTMKMTMAGPGLVIPDSFDVDEDTQHHS